MRYLLILALAGCATETHWVHPTKTDQQGYDDDYQCRKESLSVPIPVNPTLHDQRWEFWAACMRSKGWREQ